MIEEDKEEVEEKERPVVETTEADPRPGEAPEWDPVPLRITKTFLQRNANAKLEVMFPAVYEEDRSVKIKDLALANGLAVISHQRMADQIAKELGMEEYNYRSEQQAIKMEQPTIAPDALGVADQIARSAVGFGRPGSGAPEELPISPPGPPSVAAVPSNGTEPHGKRDEIGGTATAEFRRQQRQVEGMLPEVRALGEAVHELNRVLQSGLVERAVEAERKTDATGTSVTTALQKLTETMAVLVEKVSTPPQPINVTVPEQKSSVVNVTVPEQQPPVIQVTVPVPPPVVREVERDARGLITKITEHPQPSNQE